MKKDAVPGIEEDMGKLEAFAIEKGAIRAERISLTIPSRSDGALCLRSALHSSLIPLPGSRKSAA